MASTEFQDERKAIESRFATMWGALTPVKYENTPFEQPEASPWVALTIQTGEGDQITIGASNNLFRFTGIVIVQIMTPQKVGLQQNNTTSSDALCDKVTDVFRNAEFAAGALGRLTFYTPRRIVSGSDVYGFFQVNVNTRFKRDQL